MVRSASLMKTCNDPFERLSNEHDASLAHAERLGHAAEFIRTKGFSFEAFMQISRAVRFIETEIGRHKQKEEKYLYPLIERHQKGVAEAMMSEHRELWKAYCGLLEYVEDVEEGRIHTSTVQELVASATLLVELIKGHVARENEIIFPLAKRMLTSDEYEEFRAQMMLELSPIPLAENDGLKL